MKYKRTQKRSKQMWQRVEKFSIRKFSFGAASCLIGASLVGAAGTVQPVEAAISTFRDQKGGNVTTLYANQGDNPFEAGGSGVYDKVNVDQEIGIEIDWSEYSKTNPYVTVTYKYNGGYGTAALNNYGGGRPDFWFTTPVGVSEPKTITLYNLNTDKTGRTITSWSGEQGWVSFSNSVGSRYQNKEMADKLGVGDPTKWERYNDATGEEGRTYRGDLNTMFWRRIGDNIEGSPSEQGIYQSFRDNTKSMYSDWQKAADPTATIKATYKVVDPTLKNGKLVLEFGAGVKVGHGGSLVTHFKTLTVEVPVLYQDSELFEVKVPQRTGVVNTQELTETEKADIKSKILKENEDNISSAIPVTSNNKFKDNLKDGENSIVIGNDGTATITYLDGSKDTIPGTSLVYEKPQIDNNETTPANVGDYKYLKNPHAVDNINSLTGSDIASARQKFFQVNGMTTTRNEDNDEVIATVGDPSKTSQDFVGTNLEYDPRTQGFAVIRNSMPTGITIPKADLFKAKPTKVFSAVEAVEKGKQAIDNLTYLSPKEKEYYKNQLTGKTTQDDINNVVNAAIAKNSENEKAIEAKKRQVKDKINSAKYLTEAEKEALRKQVDSQGIEDPANGNGTGTQAADYTKELLDKIGQQADAKNLENAKKSTKEKIDQIKDSLKNPTADEYKTQIDGKTTVAEVEKVLEEAEKQKAKNEAQKAQEEAEKLKEEYKKQIDQIPGLSETEKEEYKKQIDQAKSKDQLDTILNDAKAQATRGKAKQTIEDLPHLNKAQKAELKEKVENASDKSEIDGIVSIAQGLDSKMDSLQKLVAEAEKVKNSDKYNTADQDKKTAFDKAKDAASKVADKTTAAPENAADTTEVTALIDKLAKAIEELTGKKVAVPVSKDALKAELDLNKDDAVKKSPAYAKETSADKKKAYDDALVKAQEVFANQDATQPQVDEALDKLQQARLALSGKAEDFTLGVKEGAAKISVEPTVGAKLSEADKDAVKAKVTANGKELDNTYAVEYGAIAEKGDKKVVPVTVTHDGITRTVDVPVEGTDAAKSPLNDPEKVKVNDVSNLSEDEKAAVKAAVKKANTNLTDDQISVDNTGKVTVTYSDKSQNELPASKTVEAKTEAEKALDKAKAKAKADLTEAANKEKAEIDADKNLTDQQKADKKTEVDNAKKAAEANIDKATTPEDVTKATEAGKKAIDAVHKTELDKAKEKAKADLTEAANKEKAEIDADKNLTDQQKADKKAEVDNVKKAAEDKINNAKTPEEVAKATDEGKKAIDAVHKTELDKAKEQAKADLTETANKEKAEIDADKNLTDQQKADKKAEVDNVKKAAEANIDKATTPEDVTKATEAGKKAIDAVHKTELDKAKEKAKADLTEAANKEKAEIDADKNLTDQQKADKKTEVDNAKKAAEANIDKATTPEDVTKATEAGKKAIDAVHKTELDKAKEKAKADLTEAANKEKAEIDADKNLTDQQKADKKAEVDNVKKAAEDKINNAKTPEEVAKATDEGKKAIDAVHKTELDKAKEQAKADLTETANKEKAEIDADKNLTDQQKADKKAEVDNVKKAAEDKINNAKTPEEVAKATDEGKKAIDAVHKTELDKAKEQAKADLTETANKEKAEIDADKNLTDQQKADKKAEVDNVKKAAEDKINNAKTPEEIAKATEEGKKAIDAVHKTDADKSTPTVTAGEVPVSVDPATDKKVAEADKKAITDAVEVPKDQPQPTGKQVKNDGAIVEGTGANAGKKVVVVEVTYPDGSKDEIEVPVRKATDKEKAKADLTDAANTEKGEIGGDTTLTDKEKEDLKAKVDEVKKAAEDKINNAKTPEEIAKATEEGKKAIADVYKPQTAKGQSTNVFKPGLDLQTALVSGKATVEKDKDLTDEEILKQLALADGVTAKVISKPTTTETGTKEAEVEVTLADSTKVTVKVSVEVVDSLGTADKDNDLAKAKEDAKKQVEEAAKDKITEIKKDPSLTEEQKQKAEEAINKAKEDANKAIDEASSAGTAKQIADQSKENIEKYDPKADTEVKKPDVTNLDEEKAKAKAEILEEAQKRINEIKNNKDLSDEAKQKAIEEINKAKDKAIEDINKGQSKDEINAAKEAGIHKINEVQPEGSIASKFEPKVPENKVEVGNPAKLSDKEREQVRQNIEGANTFPDGTTVEVKPDGTAVITYKDGSSDTISKDKLVTPANKETGTIASRTEPVIPGKTQVGNTTKLTPAEQATVKKAVEEANNFPAGTTVEVRPDGTVVITYPDKSVDTITGDKLVEKGSKQETPKVQTDAEKNPAQVPGNFVPVENTHNLTQAEQDTVAAKVKEANPAATDVKVSKDGTATLTYSDGSVNTIPGTSLVVAKDTDNEASTQAAQNPVVVPATTEVGNAHSLTPEEQAAVATKVKQANPTATDVKVSKDGTATLTYSDGSVNTIPGTSLVVQKEETSTQEQPTIAEKTKVIIPANPTKVAEATRLTDEEKEAVKKAVVDANGFGSDVKVEVAGDGTATIVFKDGSAITIPGNQLVAQDPKAQDSTKPTAEKSTVKAPAQRVDVKDITHLTDEEKEKVKVAILQANGSALDGATINVAGDGTATITFPDGSVVTILGKDTVQQSAKGESVTQEATPEYKPETTPGGDNGGNTGSSDANANVGGGSQAGGRANTGSQNPAQSQASKQLATEKESAKKAIEKAAKDKQDEIKGSPLSDKEKAELLARVEAEKQAALKEIENAKTVEDVKEVETIGVQAIAMVTVPKRPVAPNAAPQATSAPQATAGTMQDVTYQSPAGKQLPNTGSASSAALASLALVAATSGFALLGRKARRRK